MMISDDLHSEYSTAGQILSPSAIAAQGQQDIDRCHRLPLLQIVLIDPVTFGLPAR